MTSSQVSLVPANMARPPIQWSVKEVKAWLEFCVTEFSLRPVCVNKFDMNGKALTLLTRTDFIERAPHAGDVLYNVFQRCLQHERPGYLRSPVFVSTPTRVTPPSAEILPRLPQIHSDRPLYIPIRPLPSSSSCSSKSVYQATSSIMLAASDENSPVGPSVPASMLSPAPSEKSPSDTDSSHNENGQSPHSSDHEMEYGEGVNFDTRRDVKYDLSDQNDDGVCRLLWEFIYQLLQDAKWSELVSWESEVELTFRILNPTNLADAWGKQKNRSNMTYEKLSRALRYYYKMNIIKKVPGKRLTYKFLQHPATIRKGQRGARPHSSRQARAAETDHASNEATAPDSSTFLPPRIMSIPSSTSSTPLMLSNDPSRDAHSPRHHPNMDEPLEASIKPAFLRDVQDDHFFRSSQRIRGNCSQERGPFLYQDAADVAASETVKNTRSILNVSPGKHAEGMQNQHSHCYDVRQHCESDDDEFVCRSQMVAFNTSPKMNNSSLVVMDKGLKYVPNLHTARGHIYGDKSHLPLHIPEPNSHAFPYFDRIPHHNSIQGLTEAKDIFSSSSSCSSSSAMPVTLRSHTPLMFNETNCSADNRCPKLYPTTLHHRHHPYPRPLSFSCTSPLPSYAYPQQRSNHVFPDHNHRSLNHHLKHQAHAGFHQDTDHISQNNSDPYCIHHPLKQEACDQEQDEPEDLSLKTCLKKEDSSKDISEPDLPPESGTKDAHRDSPRSNSSDSAYNSDRADCAKEEILE